jgi:hypothetical protein
MLARTAAAHGELRLSGRAEGTVCMATPTDVVAHGQTSAPADRVSRRGRVARAATMIIVLVTLLTGTAVGQDDDFPFGPFRMFATTDNPNQPIVEVVVYGTDDRGRRFELTENNSGVRRSEVEGQLARFIADPRLLVTMADAYERLHPRDRLLSVDVVERAHELRGGQPTGGVTDTVVSTWKA